MKTILYLVTVALFASACDLKKNEFAIELDDSTKLEVLSYVKDNRVDLKSKVITTKWVVNDYRTDVYISNISTKIYGSKEFMPSYYSVINYSVVVFVYTGIEKVISKNTEEALNEVTSILEKYRIELRSDSGYFYRAPTWLYSFNEERRKLVKKLVPYEYNFIPLGYVLMQDNIKKDSLYILKSKF